ncbi:hypothetical protein TomTYG75_22160 [Sphingobium sp. TomTYG75]
MIAAITTALWFGLFYIGRSGIYGIYTHGERVYPNSGQIDYYMVFPACVAATLMLSGWTCNSFRAAQPLAAISTLAFFALFPYLLIYTGGI